QIFRLVYAADLLRLGRADREPHDILMKRSLTPIWRVARSNISELPAPFHGMSELAWAHLLFSKSCETCAQKTTAPNNWLYRVRLCEACAANQ
ncbi:hypothetical protein F5146DRAFT_938042, partial [Armillaria mellea]